MLNLRFHPDPDFGGLPRTQPPRPVPGVRLNVLLTEDRPQAGEHWTRQLPRLLEPQGVNAYIAQTADEAIELVQQVEFHAAVIDTGTPPGGGGASGGGRAHGRASSNLWLLELLHRLPNHPPVVMVSSPLISHREAHRLLNEALRLGVFSVLHKPVELEQLLLVFRRLLEAKYQGVWPGRQPAATEMPDKFYRRRLRHVLRQLDHTLGDAEGRQDPPVPWS